MVNRINGATTATTATTLNTKLQKIADDAKITKEEAANLTQAEFQEIKDANPEIEIEDGVDDIVAANAANDTENTANADAAATEKVDVPMPAENIDAAATEQLKAEIEKAKGEYETAKAEAQARKEEIDAAEDAYEALQADMAQAAANVADAAANAQESVSQQTNRIRQQAQDEGWDQARINAELGKISIPSISGEQRTLESVGIDVSNMADTIKNLSDLYAAQANTVDEIAQLYGGFLQVDLSTVSVTTDGMIVVNELGTGGPEVSGADGISAKDMQKFANMSNAELTEFLASDEGANIMTAMQGLANDGVNLSAENCAAIIKTMISEQNKGSDQENMDKFGTKFAGNIQVNAINGVDSSQLSEAVKKVEAPKTEEESCCCPPPKDPYVIKVGDVEYVMIQDNKDGKWDTNDILGINDNKNNLFEALKNLEGDGDVSKLSPKELEDAGIRLVAKNDDGTLAINDSSKDLKLEEGDYIDMTSLTNVDNKGDTGTFGTFKVHVGGQDYEGQETFEEMSTLQKLFGAVKNFFDGLGNVAKDIISTLMMNQEDKQYYSEKVKEKYAENKAQAEELVNDTTALGEAIIDETEDNIDDTSREYEEPDTKEEVDENTDDNDIFGDGSEENVNDKKGKGKDKQESIF